MRSMLKFWWVVALVLLLPLQVAASPAVTLWGELTQGSLLRGKTTPGTQVKLNGQPVQVSADGHFVLGFGRDAETKQTLSWQGSDAKSATSRDLTLSKRSYDIQSVKGVPQKTVTPSPEHQLRIDKENALLDRAREKLLLREDVFGRFVAPMIAPISGVYGSQRVFNGTPKRPHFGLDYAAPVGTIVKAPLSGVVTLVHEDMFYSGGTLIVDHGYGVSSTFIHLSAILVREGDEIKQGDAIAKVGAGGRASGPHLDWRINWFDTRIDPAKVLELEKHRLDLQ